MRPGGYAVVCGDVEQTEAIPMEYYVIFCVLVLVSQMDRIAVKAGMAQPRDSALRIAHALGAAIMVLLIAPLYPIVGFIKWVKTL